ncbi:Homoserine kinase [Bacteroides coprosuis DSM 18011]|uniref:Homoserine kinase n=1 Tax=Bacteroides coprosuis DSM 18011 TaxID=679937 RepID=F3ZUZ9_9BACE|nr:MULTISPECIES: homoserine kinase [Bacteroides]EGJ72457.1 Homoserine kinase [Bacteroides coprosuis DSM 18011]
MNQIKLFCPATIANVSCGFDVLGLCLESVGDEMLFEKSAEKGIRIQEIIGADLPLEVEQNVAGVAALSLYEELDPDFGVDITIYKNIKAGSGIGSSAASAAGAVFGVNALCNYPLSNKELIYYAMQGEALASGAPHADNVAPALLGGFAFIRSYDPLDIISIPTPSELYATVIHPQIELKTKDARSVVKQNISLKKAIVQCGNLGGLICGLYNSDYDLIGRSLHDEFVEPIRSLLIPNFDELQLAAIEHGALGSGISGAGPSVFALCEGRKVAEVVAKAMKEVVRGADYESEIHVSPINSQGIKIIS